MNTPTDRTGAPLSDEQAGQVPGKGSAPERPTGALSEARDDLPESDDPAGEATDGPDLDDSGDAEPTDMVALRRENAARRVQLREAREALAVAEERVAAYRWAEVAQVAGAELEHGADVLETALGGAALPDFIGDDGGIDVDRVLAVARRVKAGRPALGRRYPDMGQGSSVGFANESGASWSKAFGRS